MDVEPDKTRPSVAYIFMEYGLSHVLKIYSGGLGILAGDYVKEASDSNVDFCAVGFLYRYGYFTQTLSMEGQQVANYEAQVFPTLPIERELDENGKQIVVDVPVFRGAVSQRAATEEYFDFVSWLCDNRYWKSRIHDIHVSNPKSLVLKQEGHDAKILLGALDGYYTPRVLIKLGIQSVESMIYALKDR